MCQVRAPHLGGSGVQGMRGGGGRRPAPRTHLISLVLLVSLSFIISPSHPLSGLIKDWFTISASVLFLGSIVTLQNLIGYSIAFVGVIWYNYLRLSYSHPGGSPAAAAHGDSADGGQGGGKELNGGASIEVVSTSSEVGGNTARRGGATGQAAHPRV